MARVTVSVVFTSRGNYIKSFFKGGAGIGREDEDKEESGGLTGGNRTEVGQRRQKG